MLFLILISAFSAVPQPVYAAPNKYARAVVRDAYFFTEKNTPSSSLFAVPYTYCVEIIRDDGDWLYVRYAADAGIYRALYGYCRKEDFAIVSGVPTVTYLYKPVTLNYSASNAPTTLPTLGEIALEAAYYGTYYSGATVYSYVYCQGTFGYIEGANDDYELNSTEQTPTNGNGEESGNGKKTGWSAGAIAIIVIGAILITVVLVIFFTARKPMADA